MRKRRRPIPLRKLWVFAQVPVAGSHVLIPVEAVSREEALRIAEADPLRIGKSLCPKDVAGQPGFTDGHRDFLLFEDQATLFCFLQEHGIIPDRQATHED